VGPLILIHGCVLTLLLFLPSRTRRRHTGKLHTCSWRAACAANAAASVLATSSTRARWLQSTASDRAARHGAGLRATNTVWARLMATLTWLLFRRLARGPLVRAARSPRGIGDAAGRRARVWAERVRPRKNGGAAHASWWAQPRARRPRQQPQAPRRRRAGRQLQADRRAFRRASPRVLRLVSPAHSAQRRESRRNA